MGIVYYALKEETREAYELGKGNWLALLNENGRTPDSAEAILNIIRRDVITLPGWSEEAVADKAYQEKIAKDLASLGSVEIIGDSTDEVYPDDESDDFIWRVVKETPVKYQVVGTRYKNA